MLQAGVRRLGDPLRQMGYGRIPCSLERFYASSPRMSKSAVLKGLLQSPGMTYMMEAHNGLSAKIVEETGFQGIWAGSLAISAAMGVSTDEESSWVRVLEVVELMAGCTKIPILLDAGKQLNHESYASLKGVQRAIRKLESRGIAGVTLKDSYGRRSNSFLDDDECMVDASEFCDKLMACKNILSDPDFCLVASVDALVDGEGVDDALERASAYAEAGADAVLLQTVRGSREPDLRTFMSEWDQRTCPVIVIGDTFSQKKLHLAQELGVTNAVWSNHNMRSSIASMQQVTKSIFENNGPENVKDSQLLVPVKEVFRLNKTSELAISQKERHAWNRLRPIDEMNRHFVTPSVFLRSLVKRGTTYFAGVPDSILRDICQYIDDNVPSSHHTICANEGAAISTAAGHYMATGNVPLVYFQNSGLGNAINPLISLTHKDVFQVPMLLMIGWRGEPGKRDEPQHRVQGEIMEAQLNGMGIPTTILPDYDEGATEALDKAYEFIKEHKSPYALLVKRASFRRYDADFEELGDLEGYTLSREQVLERVCDQFSQGAAFVATTGFTTRELNEIRERQGQPQQDMYCLGSMGHCTSIALGVAIGKPETKVVCLDGDGANIMHLGAMQTIGKTKSPNLIHVVINNGTHDSVGGQPSGGYDTNFKDIAAACGYAWSERASTMEELEQALIRMSEVEGPSFLDVRVLGGARANLSRPNLNCSEIKQNFMEHLKHCP